MAFHSEISQYRNNIKALLVLHPCDGHFSLLRTEMAHSSCWSKYLCSRWVRDWGYLRFFISNVNVIHYLLYCALLYSRFNFIHKNFKWPVKRLCQTFAEITIVLCLAYLSSYYQPTGLFLWLLSLCGLLCITFTIHQHLELLKLTLRGKPFTDHLVPVPEPEVTVTNTELRDPELDGECCRM